MASQSERREATRAALIDAARRSFLENGFEATSTEAVLAGAGVSKGALYHHFQSKTDLLAEVFAAVTHETLAAAQSAAAGAGSPREALARSLKAWLRAALEPEPRRILLETGPAVLGLYRAREIEDAVTQPPVRAAIRRAVEAGEARCSDIDLTARLLNAAISELALTAIQRGLGPGELAPFDLGIEAIMDALLR